MRRWEDSIQEKAKQLWDNHKVVLLIFIIGFPMVIQILFGIFNIVSRMKSWNFRFPDSSNWIGFWGSYLGIIPSGLIAYIVAKMQIDNDNTQNKTSSIQERHVKDLFQINNKIRKLDPVFHYGRTNLAFLNNEFDKIKKVDIKNSEDLEFQLERSEESLRKVEIFVVIGELMLDIQMMPQLRDSNIYKNLRRLETDFDMLSEQINNIYNDAEDRSDEVMLFRHIAGLYKACFFHYKEMLEILSNKIYKYYE
ncbi:hypothetical protein [Leuconostoc fallax]|uniref:Uncharacterized protein n=2 Tax=Leuconostoc fallax TaxID=1251 RepID=A0A4R5N6V1_9LACO|nr:hypothetical protein [Leuconostoc fallax]MBU7455355.1 hypothetical protein [Leuconostoc fallax]TDG67534.1 hypothetical protein C5L23_001333 [Leuconostoc fallax]